MFKRGIDVKDFNGDLLKKVLYNSNLSEDKDMIKITIKKKERLS